MPAGTFQISGPFGYKFTLPTRMSASFSIRHSRSESSIQSQPEASPESSTSPAHAPQRSASDPAMYSAIPGQSQEAYPRAPSPTPTEIIPDELTQPEIVEDIKSKGIKVRDFAYEPSTYPKIPEICNPRVYLLMLDAYLWNPKQSGIVTGKLLRRLLDLGWVTELEAKTLWPKEFWEVLAAHDSRPKYPYTPLNIPMPTRPERRKALEDRRAMYLANGVPASPMPAWLGYSQAQVEDVEMRVPGGKTASSVINGKKRALEDTATSSPHSSNGPPAKRCRTSGPSTQTPGRSTHIPGQIPQQLSSSSAPSGSRPSSSPHVPSPLGPAPTTSNHQHPRSLAGRPTSPSTPSPSRPRRSLTRTLSREVTVGNL